MGVRANVTASRVTTYVNMGFQSAAINQAPTAVAIGAYAGQTDQGANCVAIGAYAGQTSQTANSIVINASGTAFNSATSGFFVRPVRSGTGGNVVCYDPLTSEIITGAGNISVAGSLIPVAANTYTLGNASYPWKDLYLGSSTLYLGNGVSVNNPAANVFAVRTSGTEKMRIDASGNVGIANGVSIGAVAGGFVSLLQGTNMNSGADPRYPYYGIGTSETGVTGIGGFGGVRVFTSASTPRVTVDQNGNVGIGTTTPTYPLHVIGTGSGSIGTHGYLQNNATPAVYFGGSASITDVSAYFSNCVSAVLYRAFSDRRIKKDISPLSNGLDKLRRLKPVEYQYIDHITKGSAPAVGFIAQDVAEHLPGAVATNRDSVPDVFMLCSVNLQESVIECENARAGELVVHTVRGEKTLQVTAVHNGMRFTPSDLAAEDLKDGHVFVFGFKVDDFHVLDKNALFTINVAATQELDRIVRKLEARIVELEALVKP